MTIDQLTVNNHQQITANRSFFDNKHLSSLDNKHLSLDNQHLTAINMPLALSDDMLLPNDFVRQASTIPRHQKSIDSGIVYPHSNHMKDRDVTTITFLLPRIAQLRQEWNERTKPKYKLNAIERASNTWMKELDLQLPTMLEASKILREDAFYLANSNMLHVDAKSLRGLYCKKALGPGDFIGFYLGKKVDIAEWINHTNLEELKTNIQYLLQVENDTTTDNRIPTTIGIDASNVDQSGFVRYINTPFLGEERLYENCFAHKLYVNDTMFVAIIALRDIRPNEELCMSYGKNLFFTRYDVLE
jgi:hypothetical protein